MAPDALLVQTNLSGAVTAIQDDPDSPDGSWLTAPGSNKNTEARTSFGTPTNPPTLGAGLQNFRVLVRKTNHSTNPSATVELYENGSLVSEIVGSTTVSSTTGQILAGSWDASSLGTSDGSLVECRVVGSVGGGSPGNRASVEVGAIEWNAETSPAVQNVNAAAASSAFDASAGTVTPGLVSVGAAAVSSAFDAPATTVEPGLASAFAEAASAAFGVPDATVTQISGQEANAAAASAAWDAPDATIEAGLALAQAAAASAAWDSPDVTALLSQLVAAEAASSIFDAPTAAIEVGLVSVQAVAASAAFDAPAAGKEKKGKSPTACSAGVDILD